MTPSQVRAALGLLKKVLPDLSSTTLATEDGGPPIVRITTVYEAPSADRKEAIGDQWEHLPPKVEEYKLSRDR